MNDLASFGAWLKRRRKALDLTQDDLAQRAGVAIGTVRKWEADERRPSRETAEHLAHVLEVPPAERPVFVKIARAELAVDWLPDGGGGAVDQAQPDQTLRASLHALPVPMTPLIGRAQEVAAVTVLLQRDDVRLVTLTGAGGTGKTRLALQVATELQHVFGDGVAFVDFAPFSDPGLITPTIALALGIRDAVDRNLFDGLAAYLRAKRFLLVLDNFEQLVDAAGLIGALLRAAARFKILVTSRTALHVSGEHEHLVPSLAPPDAHKPQSCAEVAQNAAVHLFVMRAQAVNPEFKLTDGNAATVAEICRRLDGLPLAIELAAARSKLLAPAALLARLAHPLGLLTGGGRDLHTRQQTLRATFDWSYGLLTAEEQRLFRWLGGFIGGWTLEAAEEICGEAHTTGPIVEALASLLDKSLIQADRLEASGSAGGEGRFRMLETLRAYALEHLDASGEFETMRRRHAMYFLALAEASQRHPHGPIVRNCLERLEREMDNFRAALRWSLDDPGSPAIALRLAAALWDFWVHGGIYTNDEGRQWLEAAVVVSDAIVESPSPELTLARAWVLASAGDLAWRHGDLAAAQRHSERSLDLFRRHDDDSGIGTALQVLGHVAHDQGATERATAYFEESIARFRAAGDTWRMAWSLSDLGTAAFATGNLCGSALHEQSLAIFRAIGEHTAAGWVLNRLGGEAATRGDFKGAIEFFDEAAAVLTAVGDTSAAARPCWSRDMLAIKHGDREQARASLAQMLRTVRASTDIQAIAFCLIGFGVLALACQEPLRAARLLAAAKHFAMQPATFSSSREFAKHESASRALLGDEAFVAAWAEGRAMTLEQAIGYALELDPTTD